MEKYGVTRESGNVARENEESMRRAIEREKARLAREAQIEAAKHAHAKERRDG
jgi:hypothetical protein